LFAVLSVRTDDTADHPNTTTDNKMFVVLHRESIGKHNMEFRMHKSGIHYYDPRNYASAPILSDRKHMIPREHTLTMKSNCPT
jgi:hypothetical protein